jgi:predicted Fe-S protein YdhL (DUF1289 family)
MIPPVRPTTIETPCVKICVLDPKSGLCRGCGRNVDEIARWGRFSSEERLKIMGELAGRLERLNSDATTPHATV